MRTMLFAAAAMIAFGAAGAAQAGPLTIQPVKLAPEAQKKFTEKYGQRDADQLSKQLTEALTRELTEAGATIAPGAPVSLEVTLNDAKPNRPTFKQLSDKTGLDAFYSVGIGGADLTARFVGADGATLKEVKYRWYESDISNVFTHTTWQDAHRTFRWFASRVGEAYAADVNTAAPAPAGS